MWFKLPRLVNFLNCFKSEVLLHVVIVCYQLSHKKHNQSLHQLSNYIVSVITNIQLYVSIINTITHDMLGTQQTIIAHPHS